jgi:hypothetical protein
MLHVPQMLQSRTYEVLNADSWCEVQVSSIVTLLQQDALNVQSELALFYACQRWAQHQLKVNNELGDVQENFKLKDNQDGEHNQDNSDLGALNNQHDLTVNKNNDVVEHQSDVINNGVKIRKILEPVLPHIRILSLSAQQFLKITKESCIFSEKEQLVILKCIAEPTEYKMPEGLCAKSAARNTPHVVSTTVCQVPQSDQEILDQLKYHLKMKVLMELRFTYFHLTMNLQQSEANLRISKNIIIYGFQFHTLDFAKQDSIYQALVRSDKYDEKFTLQFLCQGVCEVKFEFDGKLKYGNTKNFFFSKPIIARKDSEHTITLEFNHGVVRNHPYYYIGVAGKLNDEFSVEKCFGFCCLSQIMYKIV